MGLKQTLDISLAPRDRCKKSIKKSVRIRPLYGIINEIKTIYFLVSSIPSCCTSFVKYESKFFEHLKIDFDI